MNELTKVDQNQIVTATPQEVVESGVIAAKTLMGIVEQNKWAIPMQGKKYLVFEAWQTLARFYNYTVKTKETKYVEYGSVKGFEAVVEVLDKDGKVVGGAEATCLSDERNWSGKPLFSLKAMAQTRAAGRALRQLLSFVAVLAGYAPTNAEEVSEEVLQPTKISAPRTYQTQAVASKITDRQVNMITGLVQKDLKEGGEWLSRVTTKLWKKESFVDLSMNEASALIKLLQSEIDKRASAKSEAKSVKEELENLNVDEIIG